MSAAPLVGDVWFGTGGRRLSVADFTGRFLLLDFWTLCCVNCHHVLAELRPIEVEFADVLTVVGVHSPKFEFEKNPDSVLSAVHRHGIEHPILNDPDMSTWRAYGVRAWPTLVLIDPIGEVVGTWSGEGHGHAIAATIKELIPFYESKDQLVRGKSLYMAEAITKSPYLQPGKIEVLDSGHVLISDSGNHSLAIATFEEPNTPSTRIGSGVRGFADGDFSSTQFNEPYGAVVLPAALAQQLGYHVIVADTANHALRGVNLTSQTVITIAGTGEQWRPGDPTNGNAREVSLSTPWDIALFDNQIYIAMAGEHRLWFFDPQSGEVGIAAGTTNEGLVDGPSDQAWFAQPSGLAVIGRDLFIVDAETSAIRRMNSGTITTVIGQGLFDFGHIDGLATDARLQHPLGIVVVDSLAYLADTYNGSIRLYDNQRNTVTTIARDLAEPSDMCLTPDSTNLLVVESAKGVITQIPLGHSETVVEDELHTIRPELEIATGEITVTVTFTPPPGQKRDDRYGPSTQLVISSSPPELIVSGTGTGTDLTRVIQVNPEVTHGVLHVAAKGASCDSDSEHGACHMHQQDWGVPVRVTGSGTTEVHLTLAQ